MMKRLIIAGFLCAAAALPAHAANTNSSSSPSYYVPPTMDPLMNDRMRWTAALSDSGVLAPTRTQWMNARRAAELINAGQCREAYDYAMKKRDRFLATRVTQVCSGGA